MPAHGSINLLPKSEFETSLWGRVLKWALTYGRYILIITELVVVMAFLSRFKLDKDMSDLEDSINSRKAILEALSESENKFRITQKKLIDTKKILSTKASYTKMMENIFPHIPTSMKIKSLTISNGKLAIIADVPDKQIIGEFTQRLSSTNYWTEKTISDISYKKGDVVSFSFEATWKNNESVQSK